MELFAIALRNVFRNPRRTVLNLVAIGLGVMIVLTMRGWVTGFSTSAYQTTIDIDTAHVQVLAQGYQDEARRLPLDLRIRHLDEVTASVKGLKDVAGVSARLDFSAQIGNGESVLNVQVRGVDPAGEAAVNTLPSQLKEGRWFADPNDVVVGVGLARKLGLKVGDQVFLTAVDQYGVRNLVDGAVGAIYQSGYGIFDDNVVFTTLAKAQDFLALGPQDATRVVVKFTSIDNLEGRVAEVRAGLKAAGADAGLEAQSWRVFAKGLVDTLESRMKIITGMVFILFILVTVGILNSMSMAVQERFREIGTLRAIGLNRRGLTRLFLAEGFFLGLAGGLAGALGAGVLAWLGMTYGIDARNFLPPNVPIPLVSVMHPVYSPWEFPLAIVLAALLAVAGSWRPAQRAGKMVIRDALGAHV